VIGWTISESSDTALSATMSGGWLDVIVVQGDDIDTLSVCAWNTAPDAGACQSFPATLSETAPPVTDGS